MFAEYPASENIPEDMPTFHADADGSTHRQQENTMIQTAVKKEFPALAANAFNGCELRRTMSGTLELKLWGRFPPGWAGGLSGGLSRKGISVIGGSAKKVQTSWSAVFEMDVSRCTTDPHRIDFLGLALDGNDTAPATNITLTEFSIGEPEKQNGALDLEVRAADQLGFLAALLNRLAFLFLFPEEMNIETVNGTAVDRFRLKGIGGTPPSSTARAALQRKLQELVAR
jgi:hypothetical protein